MRAELLHPPQAGCKVCPCCREEQQELGTVQVLGSHWEVGALGGRRTHTFPESLLTARPACI